MFVILRQIHNNDNEHLKYNEYSYDLWIRINGQNTYMWSHHFFWTVVRYCLPWLHVTAVDHTCRIHDDTRGSPLSLLPQLDMKVSMHCTIKRLAFLSQVIEHRLTFICYNSFNTRGIRIFKIQGLIWLSCLWSRFGWVFDLNMILLLSVIDIFKFIKNTGEIYNNNLALSWWLFAG